MIIYIGNFLSKHGFTPTYAEFLLKELSEKYEIIKVSSIKNKFFRIIHMLFTIILNNKCKLIIIDTYSTKAFYFAWTCSKLSKLLNIKYIPILHGGNLENRFNKTPKMLRSFIKNSYKVVCPSNFLKEMFSSKISANYIVISNFINIDEYEYIKKDLNNNNVIKLFWLRAFHEIYNPLMAIKLVYRLNELGYNVSLCMVGPDKDGSLDNVIKLASRLNVLSSIEITGLLSKKEWIAKSKNYDFFINTTNIDNTPISVIEAMALGFPIFSTNVGGIPYLIKNNKEGFLFEPNNYDDMAEKIINIYKDKNLYKKISKNTRLKALEFDKRNIIKKWQNLFCKMKL